MVLGLLCQLDIFPIRHIVDISKPLFCAHSHMSPLRAHCRPVSAPLTRLIGVVAKTSLHQHGRGVSQLGGTYFCSWTLFFIDSCVMVA